MRYWVYILASRKHGTLYIGMTNDIYERINGSCRDSKVRKIVRPALMRTLESKRH